MESQNRQDPLPCGLGAVPSKRALGLAGTSLTYKFLSNYEVLQPYTHHMVGCRIVLNIKARVMK